MEQRGMSDRSSDADNSHQRENEAIEPSEEIKKLLEEKRKKKQPYSREKSIRNWIILAADIIIVAAVVGWYWHDTIRVLEVPIETRPVTRIRREAVDPLFRSGNSRFSQGTCAEDVDCFVGGCSGEVCANRPDVITTCELSETFPKKGEYVCGCVSGVCGWRKKVNKR